MYVCSLSFQNSRLFRIIVLRMVHEKFTNAVEIYKFNYNYTNCVIINYYIIINFYTTLNLQSCTHTFYYRHKPNGARPSLVLSSQAPYYIFNPFLCITTL